MKIEDNITESKNETGVKVGQTRATKDLELVVLVIKAPLAIRNEEENGYSVVILKNGRVGEFLFEIDNEHQADTAETILDLFPVLIDSTLTLNEINK